MKKLLMLFFAVSLLSSAAFAGTKEGWEVELRQLSLNITSTEVHNTDDKFAEARVKADSQTFIQGKLDFAANYFANKLFWSNTILGEYGKTYVRPVNKEETITENANKVLFTTDLTYRLWNVENFLGGFEAGPFANVGYETQFDNSNGQPLRKILRGKAGAKLFEGKYLKELYAAYVVESDYTYRPESTNTAYEAGFRAEKEIRDGVKLTAKAYYRDYQSYSEEKMSDLDYEFEGEIRLDVMLWNNLSVAPFINYYCASAQHFERVGENWYTGISISYSTFFKRAIEK